MNIFVQSLGISLLVYLCQAQLDIPPRALGFVYKDGSSDAPVKVAAYIDLTCPDSQQAYPTLQQVADYFGPTQVQLRLYLFSLPYHRNSHTISKAARVLNNYKASTNSTVYDWFTIIYANIDKLSTSATVDQNDNEVLAFLTTLAKKVSSISEEEFIEGVKNTDIDTATRLEWKYGCTRGVYGTPMFTVNDVFVSAQADWSPSQWVTLIKKLLDETSSKRKRNL